jgi:hypothetical protein
MGAHPGTCFCDRCQGRPLSIEGRRRTATKRAKAKASFAYAVVERGEIEVSSIEPFTDEGRSRLLRHINRPAGQSVKKVRISVVED